MSYRSQSVTLAAGDQITIPTGRASFVRVLRSSLDTFRIGTGMSSQGEGFQGLTLKEQPGKAFAYVTVQNDNLVSLDVTLGFFDGEIGDDRVSGTVTTESDASSVITPLADVSLIAGAATKIADGDGDTREVHFHIVSNAGTQRIGDATVAAAKGAIVPSGATHVVPCRGDIYLYSSVNIDVTVTLIGVA